jgi:hypothetical protein
VVLERSPTVGGLVMGSMGDFDGTAQTWAGFSAVRWLDGPGQQLVALRRYDAKLSGMQQAVNVLVFGAPRLVLPRRAALIHTLGQQELSSAQAFLNFSSDVDKFNVTYVKGLMTETHTNTHLSEVCAHGTYTNLISLLGNTTGFQVDSKQFRVWANLLPPTEGYPKGDSCVVPTDDARTPFNETALFNMSLTAYSPEEKEIRTFPYWDYAACKPTPLCPTLARCVRSENGCGGAVLLWQVTQKMDGACAQGARSSAAWRYCSRTWWPCRSMTSPTTWRRRTGSSRPSCSPRSSTTCTPTARPSPSRRWCTTRRSCPSSSSGLIFR